MCVLSSWGRHTLMHCSWGRLPLLVPGEGLPIPFFVSLPISTVGQASFPSLYIYSIIFFLFFCFRCIAFGRICQYTIWLRTTIISYAFLFICPVGSWSSTYWAIFYFLYFISSFSFVYSTHQLDPRLEEPFTRECGLNIDVLTSYQRNPWIYSMGGGR